MGARGGSPRAVGDFDLKLDLSGCGLTSGAMEVLASIDPPALRCLSLGENKIKTAGAVALAGAPFMQHLEHLELSNCGITPGGTKALAAAPLKLLVKLDLRDNKIRAEGGRALIASPHLDGVCRSLAFGRYAHAALRLDRCGIAFQVKGELTARFGPGARWD